MSCSVKGRGYTVSVYFVDKLTSNELMKRLKSKGLRNSDYTRAVIKDKLNDNDHEIATTSCKVSLACPLGKPLGGGGQRPLVPLLFGPPFFRLFFCVHHPVNRG
jgi:hypothetical protein